MTELSAYLINLDGSDARLKSAAGHLTAAGIAYTRVSAFDGRAMAPAQMPLYDSAASGKAYGRAMQGGEIGCYLSHRDCLERFLAGGSDFALVVEDDVAITAGAVPVLGDLIAWLAAGGGGDWDAINLGNPAKKIFTRLQVFHGPDGQVFQLCRAHYFPIATSSVLWSRAGAARFLRTFPVINMPVDAAIREMCGKRNSGLAFRPALFLREDLGSEIETGQNRKHLTGGWHQRYTIQKWRMKHRIRALGHWLAGHLR